jgi:hypothetical protein
LKCSSCHRWLHALCSLPAALTPTEYPADKNWTCPCCGADNTVHTIWLTVQLLALAAAGWWWFLVAASKGCTQS